MILLRVWNTNEGRVEKKDITGEKIKENDNEGYRNNGIRNRPKDNDAYMMISWYALVDNTNKQKQRQQKETSL